jgi:superfamily II DNA or RNA helicase
MDAVNLTLSLRDYQKKAVDDLFDGIADHRCQVLGMPTGSGKTETAAGIMMRLIESGQLPEGTRPYFICERITLVAQAADRFHLRGFNIGVMQGDNSTPRTQTEDLMVASIQTLGRSHRWPDDLGAAIVDECHIHHKAHTKLITDLSATTFIGLSATPLRRGMGKIYSRIIKGPSTQSLIDRNYLVPTKCYGPSKPDMDGVKITGGDFNQRQSAERMAVITGDICEHWQRLGEDSILV